jgi:hypothetical protein
MATPKTAGWWRSGVGGSAPKAAADDVGGRAGGVDCLLLCLVALALTQHVELAMLARCPLACVHGGSPFGVQVA